MYLVAAFPGNLYVAIAGVDVDGQPGGGYPWLRRPLQALFIVWAVWSTRAEAVDIGPRATADRAPTPSSEVTQVRLFANGREGETARAGRAPARRGRPGTT